jgi:adenine/guanine phosphoribosyltransferase-like PRPP-binding protein
MEPLDGIITPTTAFWQELLPAGVASAAIGPPYRTSYPARLPDGRTLVLPLRRIASEPDRAVASFLANHAAFDVIDALGAQMAGLAQDLQPELIVGLPTLGLVFAPLVARHLGFSNYAPFGSSRKYWYTDALSVPLRSITTPGGGKSLYVDPHLVARLRGRRVVVVDDAISSGQTTAAALALAGIVGAEVLGVVVAMIQGDRWRAQLAAAATGWAGAVHGVFYAPRFVRVEGGWEAEGDDTMTR